MILEDLNKLKQLAHAIEEKTKKLPAFDQIEKMFSEINAAILEIGSLIQKQAQDENVVSKIKMDLLKTMNGDPLYYGLTKENLNKIADIVIDSSDKNTLDIASFKVYLEQKMKKLSEKQLVELAYDKTYIIKIGRELSDSDSEIEQYDRGVEALTGMVRTPTGLDEAVDSAVNRITKNNRLRLNQVRLYYGI